LIHEYAGRLRFKHCDVYRLRRADEFADLGLDDLFDEQGVAAVEWADRVSPWLPADHLRIGLKALGETMRDLTATATGPRSAALLTELIARLQPAAADGV
jgi:tRNA threonylcarbamoyladenosine biosynthesis protein TsaE